MSPDSRRQAIMAATLPLLSEHGANVTTSQIAQAAGIAEGTIFRVFPDKRELIVATLREAMSGEAEVARIEEIPLDAPLTDRLVAALKAVEDYQRRFWALIQVFRDTGGHPAPDAVRTGKEASHPVARIAATIAALFEPDAATLGLHPLVAARLLLSLAFSNCMAGDGLAEPPATAEQLVDLFLHGALVGE
jgi:AcrR family transcriptional regulator